MTDRDDLGAALRELRRVVAGTRLWPLDLGELLIGAGVFVVGLVVGLTSGLGLLSPFYAALLVVIAFVLRAVIVLAAR